MLRQAFDGAVRAEGSMSRFAGRAQAVLADVLVSRGRLVEAGDVARFATTRLQSPNDIYYRAMAMSAQAAALAGDGDSVAADQISDDLMELLRGGLKRPTLIDRSAAQRILAMHVTWVREGRMRALRNLLNAG